VAIDQELDAEGFLQLAGQGREGVVDGGNADGLLAVQLIAAVDAVEDLAKSDGLEVILAVD